MQLPELADSCHLLPLARSTAIGHVDLCAHLCQVTVRIFERVSAAPAEHARLDFCGDAEGGEACGRMGYVRESALLPVVRR